MTLRLTTPRGEITVRAATPDDAVPLYHLRLEALAAHPIAFAADYAFTQEQGAGPWVERIEQNAARDQGMVCLASAQDGLIGMTGIYREHWPKTCHGGLIWGVYVQPEWRGLRVAEALLGECLAWARDHETAIVKLGVVTSNVPAIRCYARCGFTVYGLDPQVIHHDGTYYDELLMAHRLG